MKVICICGGGALGHVIAGTLASKGYTVHLLTNNPEKWSSSITIDSIDGKKITSSLSKISNNPKDVIPSSEMILFCLPGFAINEVLLKIKDDISPNAIVGSIVSNTGFFIMAKAVLEDRFRLFGFQRVPYIARISQYGKSADLLGYKKNLKVAFTGIKNTFEIAAEFEKMFDTPVIVLKNILESTLSNSNPILHPSRLYNLFHDWNPSRVYDREILFYESWNDESSKLLIECDNEFQEIISKLSVDMDEMPPLLKHYDSSDAESLTQKIQSIIAFKNIKAPLLAVENGFILDTNNRYFVEDIAYGLAILKCVASILKIQTPQIDKLLEWGQKIIGIELIHNHLLTGKDVENIACLNEVIICEMIQDSKHLLY